MTSILQFVERLSRWAGHGAAALFCLIGAFVVFEVAGRYLLNSPTIWTEEMSRLLQIWATYGAAAFVFQEKRLIAVDLLRGKLSAAWRCRQEVLGLVVMLGFSVVAIVWGVGVVAESLAVGRASSTMLRTPQWLFELPIPIGFALLALRLTVRLGLCLTRPAETLYEDDPDDPERQVAL